MDYWIFWYLCFRKQRNAWSSVVHAMRQLRSLLPVGRCPCCAGRVPARCCARQRFGLCRQSLVLQWKVW